MSKQWYVLQTYSQFEGQVKRALMERIEREGLQDSFGQILIPSEEVVEIKDGKKRNSQRKFFPNYVLVEMEMNDTTWHVVRSIPRVSGFVGGTAEKTLFEVGEEVRIIDGPFAEFMGTVEEVMYEKSRLKVSVLIFGRPTPVELEFHQVEKDL